MQFLRLTLCLIQNKSIIFLLPDFRKSLQSRKGYTVSRIYECVTEWSQSAPLCNHAPSLVRSLHHTGRIGEKQYQKKINHLIPPHLYPFLSITNTTFTLSLWFWNATTMSKDEVISMLLPFCKIKNWHWRRSLLLK